MKVETAVLVITSLSSWVVTIYAVRSFRRQQKLDSRDELNQVVAQAVRDALDNRLDCVGVKMDELSRYSHHWSHKLRNVLTAVVLFIQNTHPDEPTTPLLSDAMRTLQGNGNGNGGGSAFSR